MPNVDVRISCGIRGAVPANISRTVTAGPEEFDVFFPTDPDGWGYWPRRKEAEALICSILKEELFSDEVTLVQEESDLRRLGVTYLSFVFDSADWHSNMSTTLIYGE